MLGTGNNPLRTRMGIVAKAKLFVKKRIVIVVGKSIIHLLLAIPTGSVNPSSYSVNTGENDLAISPTVLL